MTTTLPPEEIAEAEAPRPIATSDPRGAHEWAAIILVLLGAFAFGVGWIAGVILLWGSKAWSTRDKLIGTLLWPGGLGGVAYAISIYSVSTGDRCAEPNCPDGSGEWLGLTLLAIAVLVPFWTASYLARRTRRGHYTF
jgi:hypothetical protein